ncbi:hypothetical protein EB796_017469 [Bugula neritina]|uniref:Uncharacterized protein n=1 Tax=Bugula neritina TaxID=10212 RepID=A0A7J7JDW5_BUGNE|nr:hypothetical protein EB796_017469 [Bugula neritina]
MTDQTSNEKAENCNGSGDTFQQTNNDDTLETLMAAYGNEVANLSNTMDEVDAALQELESQSDALYDEAQQILEEVRRDKESADTMDTSSPLADTKNS